MSEETGAPKATVEQTLALAGASRDKADAFLDLQMAEMRERHAYELSHMRLRRFSGWARAGFEFSIGLIALALVGGLGVMVWNAAHSEGYVIESFAVPPDLASRGLTGEVVAARLLDRLNVVATPSPNSVSAAQAVSASAADNVSVEIPQTGISLGELYRFLRRWLGNENHVSGELVRQENSLVVSIRVNGRDGASWQGPEAGLDGLLQKAAERVLETVVPTQHANWLMGQTPPRVDEARAIRERVLADPAATPRARAAAWNGVSLLAMNAGEQRRAAVLFRRSREADPTYALGYTNAIGAEIFLGHPEAALALLPQAAAVLEKHHENYSAASLASIRARLRTQQAELKGDFAGSVAAAELGVRSAFQPYAAILDIAAGRARQHDGGALAWLAEQPLPANFYASVGTPRRAHFARSYAAAASLQDWPRVIALAADGEKLLQDPAYSPAGRELARSVLLRPWLALARAKTGAVAEGEKLIAATPADCYDCIRIRGLIAAQARQWASADNWFAKAVADAPSIPFAHEDWGRSLLARGRPDDAIAQFTLANKKGPKFADPLEGWGEALMAKNQSHLALAKFQQAAQYAPNWGRLHLKWGQALAYTSKPDEAKAKFARAAALDLTPSEKAELASFDKLRMRQK